MDENIMDVIWVGQILGYLNLFVNESVIQYTK